MNALKMKDWIQHYHMPHMHFGSAAITHMVHDARFWAVLAIIAVMTGLIILSIWAAKRGGPTIEWYPPYMPYGY